MGVLIEQHIDFVHHYTPLHYLVFIARSSSLLSKPSIAQAGFHPRHCRSMSSGHDIARGFGAYAFLTLDRTPRILRAKLAAGFPHIDVAVSASAVEAVTFSLSRFNVAMTRYLRRDGKSGFPESATNGRYYDEKQIPIARTNADKAAMLRKHLSNNTMIEVLVHGDLELPNDTSIICFSDEDAGIARRIVSRIDVPWKVTTASPPGPYPRKSEYAQAALDFVEQALADPEWRGNGLEFDRV